MAEPHVWLLAVTHRAAVDRLRRGARRRTEPLESAALVEAPAEDPVRRVEAGRTSRATSRASRRPSARPWRCRHVEGCSYREIGRITGSRRSPRRAAAGSAFPACGG